MSESVDSSASAARAAFRKLVNGLNGSTFKRAYTNMILSTAVRSVTNGIMQHDDFLVNGLPAAKFSLPLLQQTAVPASSPLLSPAAVTSPSPPSSPASSSAALAAVFAVHGHIDPFQCAEYDLQFTSTSLKAVIGSDHPLLNQIAQYFFKVNGKRIRPAIVLLLSRAMRRGLVDDEGEEAELDQEEEEEKQQLNGSRQSSRHRDALDDILPTQFKLSEIAELMHTASLLHDDVIDESETRRGVPSVNATFGNKFAILGGDFLLSRASVQLSRLRNHDVTELMSAIIEHLVKGEILQLKATPPNFAPAASSSSSSPASPTPLDTALSLYLTKTYYKTASLIANSCHSSALLAGHSHAMQTIAFEYGRSLGLAFQVVDDILDIVGDSAVMGKEGGWDLTHGVVTAPVLYAMEADERVRRAVSRGVQTAEEGEQVRCWVVESGGVERARRLAEECGGNAVAAILRLKPSVARSALINLVQIVLNREK